MLSCTLVIISLPAILAHAIVWTNVDILPMMTSSNEKNPRNWSFVSGIHRSTVNSPHKGQWRGALMLSLICVWINSWVNNREAGESGRYRAHYDVIVMQWDICKLFAIIFDSDTTIKIKNLTLPSVKYQLFSPLSSSWILTLNLYNS